MSHRCAMLATTGLLVLAGFAPCRAHADQEVTEKAQTQEETFDSPRIADLWKRLKAGNRAALESFWREMNGKAPLVEPIAGDTHYVWVTYLWRAGPDFRNIALFGGIRTDDRKLFTHLLDTDLWYRTERTPRDARFTYGFFLNRTHEGWINPTIDPLNPHAFAGRSVVELSDAPPQPWIERLPGVPTGRLKDYTLPSRILKQERTVTIYTPPGYDSSRKRCGLLVLFDGQPYGGNPDATLIPAPVILDNLITTGQIPPIVAALVHTGPARAEELGCSDSYADFVVKEVIPWVRRGYRVSTEPREAVIGGCSLGGLMAAYCAFRHPEIFGNVLSQSGAFWYQPDAAKRGPFDTDTGWLIRQFARTRRLPLRFYLQTGRFEGNILDENRRLRDVLEAKGYRPFYSEYDGGHDYITWRGSLADGLLALMGRRARLKQATASGCRGSWRG